MKSCKHVFRVGWGRKVINETKKESNYCHGNYVTILASHNATIIMAESNILGIITHTV